MDTQPGLSPCSHSPTASLLTQRTWMIALPFTVLSLSLCLASNVFVFTMLSLSSQPLFVPPRSVYSACPRALTSTYALTSVQERALVWTAPPDGRHSSPCPGL